MQIHNFYSDLLLSIRTLFDSIIFKPDFIKYYSFNIANRTFELSRRDYKPNYALPAAIINLREDSYTFGERPNVIQNHNMNNINTIPVLVDSETEKVILQQEEHTTIQTEVNINCESQFQASEINYHIKRFLPLTKYIQLHSFTSFLEIPPDILLNYGLDFNNREITNLFVRLNKNLGESEYCYSVKFDPIIYLNSSSVNIGDSSQRSFVVNLDISFQLQMPIFLVYQPGYGTIDRISMDFYRFGHEPISEHSVRPCFNSSRTDMYDSLKRVTKRNLLIHDLNEHDLQTLDNGNYQITVQFTKSDFVIQSDFEFNIMDTTGNINFRVSPSEINTDDNYVQFQFNKTQYSKFNPSLTNPIALQFVEVRE